MTLSSAPAAPSLPLESFDGVEERELVRRAAVDEAAFLVLYRRHYPVIERYVRRRVGDPHTVDDLVAETFMTALRQVGRYRDRGLPFLAWLYRLANTRICRWYRRVGVLPGSPEGLEQCVAQDAQGAEASEAAEERERRIRSAVLALPPKLQAALTLYYFEGLSVQDVARVLACRPGTIKSRLFAAREALRRTFEERSWDE